jgi:hypothetical protein
MSNYQRTKIYYILVGDEKYYGHTQRQYLSQRTAGHRDLYRKGNQKKVYVAARALGMTDKDLICVLVENYPCANVDEARARERYYIEREGTLNMSIPGRTKKEWDEANKDKVKEYYKQYYKQYQRTRREAVNAKYRAYALKNPEVVKESQRKYALKNLEVVKVSQRKYALKNPEAVKESRRKYVLKNAEAIKESQRKYRSKNAAHINELARARGAAKKALMQTLGPASSP